MSDLINGVQPEFYESIVTRRSWWKTKADGRVFVVAFIYTDEVTPGVWKPVTVGLLELNKEDPVERPWRYFVDLYLAGEMIKTSVPKPA